MEEIVFTRTCTLHVPVSGVKEFVAGENIIVIDYGDGTCDNLATVTRNGVTETIELPSRPFRGGQGPEGGHQGKGDHKFEGDSLNYPNGGKHMMSGDSLRRPGEGSGGRGHGQRGPGMGH